MSDPSCRKSSALTRPPALPDNRPLVKLLVLLAIAADLVVASQDIDRADPIMRALVLGAAVGQASCLAAWMVFSQRPALLRTILGIAGCILLAYTAAASSRPDWRQWLTFLGSQQAISGAIFSLIRHRGLRLVHPRSAPPDGSVPAASRWQISLLSVFAAMTMLAIVLGVSRWMRLPDFDSRLIAAYIIGFALVGTMAVWSAIGQESRWWRLFVVTVLAPGLGASSTLVRGMDPWPLLSGISTFAAMTGIVCGLLVRLAGYRIAARPVPQPPSA